MGVLEELLSSRVRAGLFRILFGANDRELHLRDLARRAGLHEASIRQELKKLRRLDLVVKRRDGNRVYFRANTAHPLYPEIHKLVLKTSGIVELIGDSMTGEDIEVAFVFGSIARGEETARSDVDLMIIGEIGLRKLAALLRGVVEEVGREVNPHVMTPREYQRRLKESDHFVTNVLSGPKIYVIGSENEFEAMAQ
jgi:predicted nucleotidyltransferase